MSSPCFQIRGQEVERSRFVGLGYRCRQLRYLPESHHGSVH